MPEISLDEVYGTPAKREVSLDEVYGQAAPAAPPQGFQPSRPAMPSPNELLGDRGPVREFFGGLFQDGPPAAGRAGYSLLEAISSPVFKGRSLPELTPIGWAQASAAKAIGIDDPWQRLNEGASSLRREAEQLQAEAAEKGNPNSFSRKLGTGLYSVAPAIAAGPAGPAAPIIAGAAQSFGDTYADAKNTYTDPSMTPEQRNAAALVPAALSGATTGAVTAGMGRLLGPGVEGIKNTLGAAAGQPLRKQVAEVGKAAVKGFVQEAPEEALDQAGQIAITEASGIRPKTDLSQKAKEVAEAGAIGGILGGGISGAMSLNRGTPQERQAVMDNTPPSLPQQDVQPSTPVSPASENVPVEAAPEPPSRQVAAGREILSQVAPDVASSSEVEQELDEAPPSAAWAAPSFTHTTAHPAGSTPVGPSTPTATPSAGAPPVGGPPALPPAGPPVPPAPGAPAPAAPSRFGFDELISELRAKFQSVHNRVRRTVGERGGGNPIDWLLESANSKGNRIARQSGSPTIAEIMTHFDRQDGQGDAPIGETFHEAVGRETNRFETMLQRAIDTFADSRWWRLRTTSERNATNEELGNYLAEGAVGVPANLQPAVTGMRALLDEAQQYMRDAGVPINYEIDYFQRMMNPDEVTRNNGADFLRDVENEYRQLGVPPAEARAAARRYYDNIVYRALGISTEADEFTRGTDAATVNTESATENRVFQKAADQRLRRYYYRDAQMMLANYIRRAVHQAEVARRFGHNMERWSEQGGLRERILNEGGGAFLKQFEDVMKTELGAIKQPSESAKFWSSFAQTWGHLRYLTYSTLTSLGEPLMISMRTRNVRDSLGAFRDTFRGLVAHATRRGNARQAMDLMEDIGFLSRLTDTMTASARYTNPEFETARFNKISNDFFKAIGIAQFTEANRYAAAEAALVFANRLASDYANRRHPNLTRHDLNQFGVEDHQAFSDFVLNNRGNLLQAMQNGSPEAQALTAMVGRFISQTVMTPNRGTRARLSVRSPQGAMVYTLTSFIWEYQQTVLRRIARETKMALTDRNLEAGERALLLQPAAVMLPILILFHAALRELRDVIFDDPARAGMQKLSTSEKALRALSSSGSMGKADIALNLITGVRYNRDPATAAAGPIVGAMSAGLSQFADVSGFGESNSPNTNSSERKFAKWNYDNIARPATGYGGAMIYNHVPGAAGTTMRVASHLLPFLGADPRAREAVVGGIAGPPTQGAASSRGGSRSGGRGDSGRGSGGR